LTTRCHVLSLSRRGVLAAGTGLFLFAISLRTIIDVDYWTHLSEGRRIARALAGPSPWRQALDLLSVSGNEGPFQFPLYVFHAVGGDNLISLLVALTAAVILLPFMRLIPRTVTPGRLWMLATAFCMVATTAAFRFSPRPELPAYVLFSAALSIVARWTDRPQRRDLMVLVPLLIAWYPLHISWTIGLFVIVVSTIVRHGPAALVRELLPPAGRMRIVAAVLFAGAGGFAMIRIVQFVALVARNLFGTAVLARVTEMRPLW